MTIKTTISGIIDKVAHREPAAVRVLLYDANLGQAHAQSALGDIYRKGSLVTKDLAAAAKWYRLAAEQGDAHAQFNLGALAMAGHGVPQDDAEAVRWYRRAADQGDALAQFNLGAMYWNGRGVAQDYVQACMWFEVSASRGTQTAAVNLGEIMQLMTPTQILDARELARAWQPVKQAAEAT
jgi:TPR repeat protein